ncbi:recombinase family protein [Nocardia sp. NPDC059091]|uniref:recombinase family protein n=1 Tax=unclassified Nocardia TaxID=2637762 RepID=UPI0036B84FA2
MGGPFRVGYCRCSTDEQDVEIQTEQLLALGVPRERIFIDKGFSGTTRKNRAGLDNALAAVTSAAAAVTGQQVVLTTTKFDRFARNMAEAGEILTGLRERDVLFRGSGASARNLALASKYTARQHDSSPHARIRVHMRAGAKSGIGRNSMHYLRKRGPRSGATR